MTIAEQLRADWQPELDRAIEEAVVGPVVNGLSVGYVVAEVAARHGVTADEILGRSRERHIVAARTDVCRVLRAQKWSLPSIGKALGRHHTSVMSLLREDRRHGNHVEKA